MNIRSSKENDCIVSTLVNIFIYYLPKWCIVVRNGTAFIIIDNCMIPC